jgi:hypothetical protein
MALLPQLIVFLVFSVVIPACSAAGLTDIDWHAMSVLLEPRGPCTHLTVTYYNHSWAELSNETKTAFLRCLSSHGKYDGSDDECGVLFRRPVIDEVAGVYNADDWLDWSQMTTEKQAAVIKCVMVHFVVDSIKLKHSNVLGWVPADVFTNTLRRLAVLNVAWRYYLVTQQYKQDQANGLKNTPPSMINQWRQLGLYVEHYGPDDRATTLNDEAPYELKDYLSWNGIRITTPIQMQELDAIWEDDFARTLIRTFRGMALQDVINLILPKNP